MGEELYADLKAQLPALKEANIEILESEGKKYAVAFTTRIDTHPQTKPKDRITHDIIDLVQLTKQL